MYRQGDVLLIPTNDCIPADAQPASIEDDRYVLARGEATGHHHSVESRVATLFMLATGMRLLEVLRQTQLLHQEHAPIDLPPGRYCVVRQREYRWGEQRQVED